MTADRDAEISARPVTPAAAAQALAEVAAVAERATWRPNPSAAGALALIYGALLAVNVWGNLGAMVPLLLLLGGAALFLLRREVFNPQVRARLRQNPEREPQPGRGQHLSSLTWSLWPFVSIVAPAEPVWVGLLLGGAAAGHAHWTLTRGSGFHDSDS